MVQGLPVSGKKEELVERLEAAVNTDLLDENDDDLDQVNIGFTVITNQINHEKMCSKVIFMQVVIF